MPPSTSPEPNPVDHLFLIGYRGSGKTSVGKQLADQLDLHFEDTDRLIVQRIAGTIADYFASHGEPAFRKLETEVIQELCQRTERVVISLGGGAPITEANQSWIKQGTVVYLQATAEVLWKRISEDQHSAQQRPDLTDRGGLEEVVTMLKKRESIYLACADIAIDTTGKSVADVAKQISKWLAR